MVMILVVGIFPVVSIGVGAHGIAGGWEWIVRTNFKCLKEMSEQKVVYGWMERVM